MRALEFNKIYVIESLRKEDYKTGQELYNDIIKRRLQQKSLDNNFELMLPNSKSELYVCLAKIKAEVVKNLVNPILHLELHGSKKGLELSSNEIVTWEELRETLIELNVLSKGNLFLTIASCYGGYIYTAIKPNLRSPFWGFVGAFDIVHSEEIIVNFSAFYDEFIQTLDFNKSVDTLNKSNPKNISKFRFQNTEFVFNVAYENYEKNHLTKEAVKDRVEKGLVDFKKEYVGEFLSDNAIKIILEHIMVGKKELLKEHLMTHFFMWDLFPDLK